MTDAWGGLLEKLWWRTCDDAEDEKDVHDAALTLLDVAVTLWHDHGAAEGATAQHLSEQLQTVVKNVWAREGVPPTRPDDLYDEED